MPFAGRQYRYDAAGQLTRIEDAGTGNTEYRYDPIGRLLEAVGPMHRLIEEQSPSGEQRYEWDACQPLESGDGRGNVTPR